MMSEQSQHVDPGDAVPFPPRYWWLKRIGGACVVLLVVLIGVRLWWGWYAERQIESRIAHYRSLGQPVLREDFAAPELADDENAAHFLMQAAAALVQPDGVTLTADDILGNPELVTQYPAEARKLIEANRPALALAREARSRPRANWGVKIATPAIDTVLRHLGSQRSLVKHLAATAIHDHAIGDDAVAIESVYDVLMVGERVADRPFTLITHLVFIAISWNATSTLETIVPDLRVQDAGSELPSPSPAARAQIHALIRVLTEENEYRESWRQAMLSERLQQLDTMQFVTSGAVVGPGGSLPISLRLSVRPAWRLDTLRMIDAASKVAEAGVADDFPTAQANMPKDFDDDVHGVHRLARMLSSILWPAFGRATETHFKGLAERRMAATALAIRLYQIDHGQRPGTLAELVPDYMETVPLDPFAADDRVLGYLPDAESSRLYCIGRDGVDDAGEFTLGRYGDVESDSPDLVFFLNGDRPRSPAEYPREEDSAGQAVNDREDEEHDEGDDEEDEPAGEQP